VRLSVGEGVHEQAQGRPTQEDVQKLKVRLGALGAQLGLGMNWS